MEFFKLWSVRACLAYIVLWILFLFPYSGLFLMFGMAMAGPYLWGLIPHVIVLGLIFDIRANRLNKIFWVVPILIYGGYFCFYMYEEIQIKIVEMELRNKNPEFIIKYDPKIHSLISNDSGNTGKIGKIAVVYDENTNFPGRYLSYRIATYDLCKKVTELKIDDLHTFGIISMGQESFDAFSGIDTSNLCEIRSVETPHKKLIKVVKTDEDEYSIGNVRKFIYQTKYDFYVDGQKLGAFVGARVEHLSLFPFILGGCGLNSAAAKWQCGIGFRRQLKGLDVWPSSVDKDLYGLNPVTAMLQIEKYDEKSIEDFSNFLDTEIYVQSLSRKKNLETPEDFNRWGIRKDSLYNPKIFKIGDLDALQGVVYDGNKGGVFYDFIKEHQGKTVYLDIDAKPNVHQEYFMNYGVCKARENCTGSTDDVYFFINSNGEPHYFPEAGKFKGVFAVGSTEIINHHYNNGENDTSTKLTFLRSDP